MSCDFVGSRTQDCHPHLCLCQAIAREPESLTPAEEFALSEAVTHWASDPIAAEGAFEPRGQLLTTEQQQRTTVIDVALSFDSGASITESALSPRSDTQPVTTFVEKSREWENVSDSDAGDVNLAEVWSDGNRFLQEELMHEELALGESVPDHGAFPDMCDKNDGLLPNIPNSGFGGERLGGYSPQPKEMSVKIMNMGPKYIHGRTPMGDVYINPKMTSLVRTCGGEGSVIKTKMIKSHAGSTFPWKVIEIIVPKSKTNQIVDVEVTKSRTSKGARIHGGVRKDNGDKVWIDKFFTNIVFAQTATTLKMKLIKNEHEGKYPWKVKYIWPEQRRNA